MSNIPTHSVPLTVSRDVQPSSTWKLTLLQQAARRAVFSRLHRLSHGAITLVDGQGHTHFGATTQACPLHVTVTIHSPRSYSDIAFGGSIGAAEAYIQGGWTCDDLTGLVRIMVLNRHILDHLEQGLARLSAPLHMLFHALHRNTTNRSRRNIAAHYDVSNDFFALFLDETMTYSCGVFDRPDSTLYEASLAKYERICQKLHLQPNDHVMEIGAGWGGFALYAAKRYGCRVTTTTISHQQYQLAQARIARAGLSDRIQLQLEDYRNLRGHYDKLVSIEMIEAVGYAYYDTYFNKCGELLKPNGIMLLQAITIQDQHYEKAKRSVDFIQRYIFPGSCIPSITALCNALTRASDLRLFYLEDIGAHYPLTLRAWRRRLLAHADRIKALGFSASFLRMWEYYFAYCEGGFLERSISNVQMVLVKPRSRISSA